MKNNIKKLRKEHNLTLQQMADDLNISNNAISQYENNKRNPNMDMLFKISNYFNVSMNDLLNLPDLPPLPEKNKVENWGIEFLNEINDDTDMETLVNNKSFKDICDIYNFISVNIEDKQENYMNIFLTSGIKFMDFVNKKFNYFGNNETSKNDDLLKKFKYEYKRIGENNTKIVIDLMTKMKHK